MIKLRWKNQIDKHDLEAAEAYLRLVFEPDEVKEAVSKLRKHRSTVEKFKVRDILRASQNVLRPESDENVRDQFANIMRGKPLVPLCLVRKANKLFIADGYHRMCATYYLDQECEMHCVVVGIG